MNSILYTQSKECQVKSWPLHKGPCKVSSDAKKAMSADPGAAQQVANLKKWHSSHTTILRHAIICALDLGNTPANADNKMVFLQVELKPDHAKLPPNQKYHPVGGFDMTRDEARDMLAPSGGSRILESHLASHEHMKKKGGLGVAPLILEAQGLVDVLNIPLPSSKGAKEAQAAMDWGQNWVAGLQTALEMGYATAPVS